MTNDDLYLSVFLARSNRTLVIDGDGFSVWIYVLQGQQLSVDFSGILCSLGKLSSEVEEVQRFTREGNQPPLLLNYATELAVQEDLNQEDIRVEELDEDLIVVYIDDDAYAQVDTRLRKVYSRALNQSGPYGEPFELAMPRERGEDDEQLD